MANSFPNASIQDFLISYSYWKDYLPIKILLFQFLMIREKKMGLNTTFTTRSR